MDLFIVDVRNDCSVADIPVDVLRTDTIMGNLEKSKELAGVVVGLVR